MPHRWHADNMMVVIAFGAVRCVFLARGWGRRVRRLALQAGQPADGLEPARRVGDCPLIACHAVARERPQLSQLRGGFQLACTAWMVTAVCEAPCPSWRCSASII